MSIRNISITIFFLFINTAAIAGLIFVVRSYYALTPVPLTSVERTFPLKKTPDMLEPRIIPPPEDEAMPASEDEIIIHRLPPTEFQLDVPFTSQAPEGNWEQPWQDACEEAAALMIDAFYKGYGVSPLFARDELLRMVAWQDEHDWGYSIDADQVAQFLNEYVLYSHTDRRARVIEYPTVEELKAFVAAGVPVLVLADGQALENPYFSGDGPVYHALVITGYTENTFITNDPGTKRGEGFVYPTERLMGAIHDWNDGNVPEGVPRVVVVDGAIDKEGDL